MSAATDPTTEPTTEPTTSEAADPNQPGTFTLANDDVFPGMSVDHIMKESVSATNHLPPALNEKDQPKDFYTPEELKDDFFGGSVPEVEHILPANAQKDQPMDEGDCPRSPTEKLGSKGCISKKPKWFWWALLSVGMLILVGGVVGGAIAATSGGGGSSNEVENSSSEVSDVDTSRCSGTTPSPSSPNDESPLVSSAPSPTPSQSIQSPTINPSDQPSGEFAINDVCENAIEVDLGDWVFGSTIRANSTGDGTSSPGVWYKLTGVDGPVTVSTCNSPTFDTDLLVFRGTGCESLQQMGEGAGECASGTGSLLTWSASSAETYYILVFGEFSFGQGIFDLEVLDGGNDLCQHSQDVAMGMSVQGSTINATRYGDGTSSPGVWYQLTGVDGPVTVSTCNSPTFDTDLLVFRGTGCGSLQQLGEGAGECASGIGSLLTWSASSAETYYILVFGELPFGRGTFSLDLFYL